MESSCYMGRTWKWFEVVLADCRGRVITGFHIIYALLSLPGPHRSKVCSYEWNSMRFGPMPFRNGGSTPFIDITVY